jgi:hypothetical protein
MWDLSFVFLRLPSYSTTECFGDRTGGKVLRLAYYTDFQGNTAVCRGKGVILPLPFAVATLLM